MTSHCIKWVVLSDCWSVRLSATGVAEEASACISFEAAEPVTEPDLRCAVIMVVEYVKERIFFLLVIKTKLYL